MGGVRARGPTNNLPRTTSIFIFTFAAGFQHDPFSSLGKPSNVTRASIGACGLGTSRQPSRRRHLCADPLDYIERTISLFTRSCARTFDQRATIDGTVSSGFFASSSRFAEHATWFSCVTESFC